MKKRWQVAAWLAMIGGFLPAGMVHAQPRPRPNLQPVEMPEEIPSWAQLTFPTTADTILPSLADPHQPFTNRIERRGEQYAFLYEGSDQTIEFFYKPDTGTLSDITLRSGTIQAQPLRGGGLVLDIEDGGQTRPTAITRTLEQIELEGQTLHTRWRWRAADHDFPVTMGLSIRQKSLIIDLSADTDRVGMVRTGSVTAETKIDLLEHIAGFEIVGTSGTSGGPAVARVGDLFITSLFDWYGSKGSMPFGESKILGDNESLYGSGVSYLPGMDGRRQPPRERLFVTASNRLFEVLPNIANPASPWKETTKRLVWMARPWPKDMARERQLMRRLKNHGLDHLMVIYPDTTPDQTPAMHEHFDQFKSWGHRATTATNFQMLDAGAEADGFAAALRLQAEHLHEQRMRFGLVVGQGGQPMFHAGLTDGNIFAAPTFADAMGPLDFLLNKIHPLVNNCGPGWDWHAENPAQPSDEKIDHWLASTIALGNLGRLYTPPEPSAASNSESNALSDPAITAAMLKSYFMIQQLQGYYAMIKPLDIFYHDDSRFLGIEQALQSDALRQRQVLIKYASGLGVYVNLGTQNWPVSSPVGEFLIPPNGHVATAPDGFVSYSAMIGGRRIDFSSGRHYTYCNGHGTPTDFGILRAAHAYLMRANDERIEIIPAPFQGQETVAVDHRMLAGNEVVMMVRITTYDADGAIVDVSASSLRRPRVGIRIRPDGFRYVMTME